MQNSYYDQKQPIPQAGLDQQQGYNWFQNEKGKATLSSFLSQKNTPQNPNQQPQYYEDQNQSRRQQPQQDQVYDNRQSNQPNSIYNKDINQKNPNDKDQFMQSFGKKGNQQENQQQRYSNPQFFEKYDDHNDPPMNVNSPIYQPPLKISQQYIDPLDNSLQSRNNNHPHQNNFQQSQILNPNQLNNPHQQSNFYNPSNNEIQSSILNPNSPQKSQQKTIQRHTPIKGSQQLDQNKSSSQYDDDQLKQIIDEFTNQSINQQSIVPYEQFIRFPQKEQEQVYITLCNKIIRAKELLLVCTKRLKKYRQDFEMETDEKVKIAEAKTEYYYNQLERVKLYQVDESHRQQQIIDRLHEMINIEKKKFNELVQLQQKNQVQFQVQSSPIQESSKQEYKYGVCPNLEEARKLKYQFLQENTEEFDQSEEGVYQRVLNEENKLQKQIKEIQNKEGKITEIQNQVFINLFILLVFRNINQRERKYFKTFEKCGRYQKKFEQAWNFIRIKTQVNRKDNEDLSNRDESYTGLMELSKQLEEDIKNLNEKQKLISDRIQFSHKFNKIYQEFKTIYLAYKNQKFKLDDYEEIIKKLLSDNFQYMAEIEKDNLLENIEKTKKQYKDLLNFNIDAN